MWYLFLSLFLVSGISITQSPTRAPTLKPTTQAPSTPAPTCAPPLFPRAQIMYKGDTNCTEVQCVCMN
jgi:hypothetical protein